MAVESLHVNTVYPHADNRYEWVEATVNFAVDPELLANERIVDLELAPRDEDGLVRFDADLKLLRPVDGGNGKLMFIVPNRGVPTLAPWLKNGFLLERGYTIASCGWQWDVQRGAGILGHDGASGRRGPRLHASGMAFGQRRRCPPPQLHGAGDRRAARRRRGDVHLHRLPDRRHQRPRGDPDGADIPGCRGHHDPRENWRFTDETHLVLDGGFKAFHWYELVYRTTQAPVAGAGLLAIRDIVSHLRTEGIEHAFAYGVSQAGRLLRQFLTDGLNVDESGMTVFDGVFSEFASASTGEFNHRYAQPAIAQVTGFGNTAPFAASELLARQRELGCVPKTMFINSATEYWYSGGALLHVDPFTGRDLPEDPDVRTYLLASTDHFGSSKLKNASPTANPVHHLDVTPVNRALFVALEEWVCEGVEPPQSKVPRTSDGTAVARKEILSVFSHTNAPDPSALPYTRQIDLGPDADRGIGTWPVKQGESFVDLVSAVDADGNEVAGIRLPAVAAPLAAYTGWNPRRHIEELPDVLYERVGSKLAFPPGRPSVTERYPSREDYVAAARAAAESLVAERFMLADEIESVVKKAAADYC